MKKVIFAAVAVFAFSFSNAQDGALTVGAHVGLPMGDIDESFSLNAGVDVAYMWSIDDKFQVGATAGYTTYTAKERTIGPIKIKGDNISFIPVAASAQYLLADKFFVGADLGYAIAAGENKDGGLYYQPKLGYNADAFQVFVGYKGISVDDSTAASVNLGFIYKL